MFLQWNNIKLVILRRVFIFSLMGGYGRPTGAPLRLYVSGRDSGRGVAIVIDDFGYWGEGTEERCLPLDRPPHKIDAIKGKRRGRRKTVGPPKRQILHMPMELTTERKAGGRQRLLFEYDRR